MKIVSFLIICLFVFPYLALSSTPDPPAKPDHYCDDKESWQQWEQIIAVNHSSDEVLSLYAFRVGLCSMVKSGQVETTRATQLFERMRDIVLKGMEEEERRMKKESGI